mmetsp:Transcript_17128/g.54735  ORF Transcript_17128/g.54735 Transcript_17128/m.54735 type:complete len:118 (-) Transcript_17128:81-434(-)
MPDKEGGGLVWLSGWGVGMNNSREESPTDAAIAALVRARQEAADRIKARAAEATKWTKDVSVRASTFTSFDVDVRERLFKEYSALAAAASPVLRERGAGIGRSIFSAVIPATTPVIG